MNHESSLEDRLNSIGAGLRQRPSLTNRLMDEVRKSVGNDSPADRPKPTPPVTIRRRQFLAVSAGTVATIAVALLFAVTLFPSRSVGWEEVTKALQSQKWIRGRVTFESGEPGIVWLSPQRQVWAFRLGKSSYFHDGREKTKFEYHGQGKPITKLPLGENDTQRILPIDALSQNKDAIGPWLFGEKIVDQKRIEVKDGEKTWIEFQLVFWRGDNNHATLRVDPETKLPVYLLSTSKGHKWEFDYPAEGPTDIYALGVPRDTRIDNQMPSENVVRVLDAMAAGRASIGDFRLIVGQSNQTSSVVYRKGSKWRVDSWGFRPRTVGEPANEPELDKSLEELLKFSQTVPVFICDGKAVWENSTFRNNKPLWKVTRYPAPQDFMSGEDLGSLSLAPGAKIASLLFPDLYPKRGWGFEFDSKPADAPGCVLIKRSAEITLPNMTGHEWYYLDPAKGYVLVRAERFNLPTDTPANPVAAESRDTIKMESFRQSPQGFWYPTVVVSSRPGKLKSPDATTRYHFDFDADLPDSLFVVDDIQPEAK